LAVLLGACGRSFTNPAAQGAQLAAFADRSALAPLGVAHVTASNGVPPYHLELASADTHSGDGARVESGALVYHAGAQGDASDLVHVVDARGQQVVLVFQVGPPLAISPQLVPLRPGGTWTFSV